jgi:phytoene dehydrogenase-like protein
MLLSASTVGNLVGGGIMDIRQFLFRPTWKHYASSANDVYICASSPPSGRGVHGMCGYDGAKMAISRLKRNYAVERMRASAI